MSSPLTRVALPAPLNEASGMAPVRPPSILGELEADEAWYVIHDEGDLGAMVSIIVRRGTDYAVLPLAIEPSDSVPAGRSFELTDAEAIALDESAGSSFLIVGSGFIGPKNRVDQRRSFVARVDHRSGLTATATVVELGSSLMDAVNEALDAEQVDTMPLAKSVGKKLPSPNTQLVNIEGAVVVGRDLVLGLRWPVSKRGEPILATIPNFSGLFDAETPAPRVDLTPIVGVGSPKRPAGIRALSSVPGKATTLVHAIIGPTDRSIAAKNVRAAALEHITIDLGLTPDSERSTVRSIRSFEGYRKVEALAPLGDDWIYALDDEDAIVLLVPDDQVS